MHLKYETDEEIEKLAHELAPGYPYTDLSIYKLLISYRNFVMRGITKKEAEFRISARQIWNP